MSEKYSRIKWTCFCGSEGSLLISETHYYNSSNGENLGCVKCNRFLHFKIDRFYVLQPVDNYINNTLDIADSKKAEESTA